MAIDLSRYRAEFPVTERYAFLNHAGVSPYNRRITQALAEHTALVQATPFDHLREPFVAMLARIKQGAARLVDAASADEIVTMPNTATGINTAALALPLRAGDNVLVLDGDYPANIYPWMNLAPKGVLTKVVPQHEGGLDLNRLEARIDKRTRAIALSTVQFATGFRNDLKAVGELCRQRGIYFVVDGIQSTGAFPLSVRECNIDFYAVGGQKWMLSAMGSGFLYVRAELMDELELGPYVGSASMVDAFNFLDYNFTLQPTADRFNLGTPNFPSLVALDVALALFHEIGVEQIAERILALTGTLIEDLQRRGLRVVSNLKREHRSGIVIVEAANPEASYEALKAAGVMAAIRGAGVRLAPHFYNSEEDVLRVGEALEKAES
jgi:cysteine desulfurase / selenocysteine lyase